MTGATIDHLVSVTVFLAAILIFVGLFSQTIQTVISYQRHRYIATKCSDLLDSILLNPGYPYDWGTNSTSARSLTFFGLQEPEFQEYRMSPFSLMRLLSSSGDRVFSSQTGKYYSNVSWGINGGYLLFEESDCTNYTNAAKVLGINGTYGFQLTVTPTLTVGITQEPADPLKFKIQVNGPGFPLGYANIDCLIFWANTTTGPNTPPILNCYFASNSVQTDSTGTVYEEFPYLNSQIAYTLIVKASGKGLYGLGYISHETITSSGNVIPFLDSYQDGTANISLTHKWGKEDPPANVGDLYFNASFYILPDNFEPIPSGNLAGKLNGTDIPYQPMPVAANHTGFLVTAYCKGSDYGMVVMPFGIGSIGASVVFGNDPSDRDWVTTDLRQVLVGDIAYQAKLAIWSVRSDQEMG